tara:strand:- start:308 stop:886 length:579 start_codon:yes stop_codon:yes gene_type:complete
MGAGKKEQGMIELQGDPTAYDGSLGHSDLVNLKASFPSSPLFGGHTLPHPTTPTIANMPLTDEGITDFFKLLLNAPIFKTVFGSYTGLEGGKAGFVDMDYDQNIPSPKAHPIPKDLGDDKGMPYPYKVPNPTNAPEDDLYNPEAKGAAPLGFQDGQKNVSFGDGIGSVLEFEDSSLNIAAKDFTKMVPGKGS